MLCIVIENAYLISKLLLKNMDNNKERIMTTMKYLIIVENSLDHANSCTCVIYI